MSTADPESSPPEAPPPGYRILHQVRRVHLYLGLFLSPWVLAYALSTALMNHRESVRAYLGTPSAHTSPRQQPYSRTFSTDTPTETIARLILDDIGLPGAHRFSGGTPGKPLVIERHHPLGYQRVTWHRDTGTLEIDREPFHTTTLLERLHRRRGYHHPYPLEDAWAASVDLTMVAMLFWAISGVWIGWSMPDTRLAGGLSLASGLALFLLFLLRL